MADIKKVIKGLECCLAIKNAGTQTCFDCPYRELDGKGNVSCEDWLMEDALAPLKEQDELLKHEYWRGYNNGMADERGLHEGTIMQTFSPD